MKAPERSGCVTCGDQAVTARVLSVVGSDALVETGHGTEWVAVDLVPDAAPGELLLCHAALALLRVEEDAP